MPKGIPLTQAEIKERRCEISRAAVDLFIAQGFNETPMHQVARTVGLGKSTLYDYFTSKDDIVVYVLNNLMNDLRQRARSILSQEGNAVEQLHRLMKMHLAFLLENKALYLGLMFEAQHLKVESQQQIQVGRYAFQDLIKDLIKKGIEEGSIRPVDPTMAMKTVISMMTPVVYTSRPSGTPEEMLESGLDIILRGLQA